MDQPRFRPPFRNRETPATIIPAERAGGTPPPVPEDTTTTYPFDRPRLTYVRRYRSGMMGWERPQAGRRRRLARNVAQAAPRQYSNPDYPKKIVARNHPDDFEPWPTGRALDRRKGVR